MADLNDGGNAEAPEPSEVNDARRAEPADADQSVADSVDDSDSTVQKPTRKKKVLIGAGVIAAAAAVIAGVVYATRVPEPVKPVAQGETIIVPNPIEVAGEGDDIPKTITVPVDSTCPMTPSGAIGAPSDISHACHYEQNGALFYTTHAARGPERGGLEDIKYLKAGDDVTIGDSKYKVQDVNTYLNNKLPSALFQPGVLALVTCHMDAANDAGAEFTMTDVVTLVEA